MATVARIKNNDLLLAGEVDERLPAITDGLIAHYPFDDSMNKIVNDFSTVPGRILQGVVCMIFVRVYL